MTWHHTGTATGGLTAFYCDLVHSLSWGTQPLCLLGHPSHDRLPDFKMKETAGTTAPKRKPLHVLLRTSPPVAHAPHSGAADRRAAQTGPKTVQRAGAEASRAGTSGCLRLLRTRGTKGTQLGDVPLAWAPCELTHRRPHRRQRERKAPHLVCWPWPRGAGSPWTCRSPAPASGPRRRGLGWVPAGLRDGNAGKHR